MIGRTKPQAGTDYCLVADALIDGSGREVLDRPAIRVAGARVQAVETRGKAWRRPRGMPVLDTRGCTVLPGLIDSHVHLSFDDRLTDLEIASCMVSADPADLLEVMQRNAESALRGGVTTLRDCGAPARVATKARSLLERGEWSGPRVMVCGRPITTPRGHCHWMGCIAEGEANVRNATRALLAEGVDFIKVMATGGRMTEGSDPHSPQYSTDELRAITAEAHARDRRVAAHVLSTEGLRRALAAGVDTIEHGWLIFDDADKPDRVVAEKMAASGVFGSLTAHQGLRDLLLSGDIRQLRSRLATHRLFREAGVPLVVHSDAGTPCTRFEDFVLSVQVFMSGLETSLCDAVAAATSTAAAALGIEAEVGTVEVGKRADLLVIEGDPREDDDALRRFRYVVLNGEIRVEEGAVIQSPV